MTGLEVSLRCLFQDGIIQGNVGYQLLQASILSLQDLELLRLLYPHATVFFTPPVVSLFGDPDLPAGFTHCTSLVLQEFSFTQLIDNLLRRMRFLGHDLPPLFLSSSLTLQLDSFLGGRPDIHISGGVLR